jgi:hypothetical protein
MFAFSEREMEQFAFARNAASMKVALRNLWHLGNGIQMDVSSPRRRR